MELLFSQLMKLIAYQSGDMTFVQTTGMFFVSQSLQVSLLSSAASVDDLSFLNKSPAAGFFRKLSVLRENFCASSLPFLEYDVPIMALTATATAHVQEDILESLHLSKETKTVLTSFFRPNLQFSVSFPP